MAGSLRHHEDAAARHDKAAVTHDRAAAFWQQEGNRALADLHRDAAVHERAGAALERRWADLIAFGDAGDAAAAMASHRSPSAALGLAHALADAGLAPQRRD
jgi:hypothetical protein